MADPRSDAPRSGPPRRPGVPIGRVLGVPVHLHPSWLLLAAFVTVTYGEAVQVRLGLAPAPAYLVGFGFVCCLLVSVLLHELGHALIARWYRIGVRGITVEMLGGYTEMDGDVPRPRVELAVSLAGPAVSLTLGLAATGAAVVLSTGTVAWLIAFQVAAANLIVALFNVLPGLPLDGGRALRAVVWAVRGDRNAGTLVAGWTGRVVAVVTLTGAVLLYAAALLSPIGLVFMLLVAFTLWQGATGAIRLARITSRLPLIDLRKLARPVYRVVTGTPLAEAERRAAEAGRPDGPLGVTDATGRLVALVEPEAAAAVPAQRRPWIIVDAVARSVSEIGLMPVDLRGEAVIQAVQRHPAAEYLVTSGDDVVGVLRLTDLAHLLEPKGTPTS